MLLVGLCGCCASWYVTENACLAFKPGDPFEHARLPYRTDHQATNWSHSQATGWTPCLQNVSVPANSLMHLVNEDTLNTVIIMP